MKEPKKTEEKENKKRRRDIPRKTFSDKPYLYEEFEDQVDFDDALSPYGKSFYDEENPFIPSEY